MVVGFIYGGEGQTLRYLPESLADPPQFDLAEDIGIRGDLLRRAHMDTYRCNACRIQSIVPSLDGMDPGHSSAGPKAG